MPVPPTYLGPLYGMYGYKGSLGEAAVYRPEGVVTPGSGAFGTIAARMKVRAALGLFARVSEWTLTGGLSVTESVGSDDYIYAGSINTKFTARAVESDTIADELGLPYISGWQSDTTDQVDWTLTGMQYDGPGDEGEYRYQTKPWPFVFGSGFIMGAGKLGTVDEDGTEYDYVGLTIPFDFGISIDSDLEADIGLPGVNGIDAGPGTVVLPPTKGGSWEGSGQTTFPLRLAARATVGVTLGAASGSFTLQPTKFWSWDPGDGGGPIYDEDTGAWLRTPPPPA